MNQMDKLVNKLQKTGVQIAEIRNNEISVCVGNGVFSSRNVLVKRLQKKHYETIDPSLHGYKLLKKEIGLTVSLIPV